MNLRAALVRTALATLSRIAPRAGGRLALRLFRRPAGRSRLRPAEEPLMRQARRDRLRVNGADVAVYAWGGGERPVLLMHGWAFRASRFAPLVQALLERGYSPVAFDAPGHGDSGGATSTILDYREIARRLHERHGRFAAVIGHSVGGTAAFFAVRGQVTADRLVSISAPSGFDHLVDRFCEQLRLGPRPKAELRRQIERRMFPGEADIWARFAATYRPAEHTHPILVIHDDADDMIDPGQARRIAAAYGQHSDLLVTRGLGHRRLIADPAVIDAILDFAAATEPVADPVADPADPAGPVGAA